MLYADPGIDRIDRSSRSFDGKVESSGTQNSESVDRCCRLFVLHLHARNLKCNSGFVPWQMLSSLAGFGFMQFVSTATASVLFYYVKLFITVSFTRSACCGER